MADTPAENNPLWEDNELQFARLLCELVANDYDPDLTALSMDLDDEELDELVERAHCVWEAAKARI